MIEGASQLHQALYAAIEANDVDALNRLMQSHFDDIVTEFDSWTTVPAEIRADQSAVSRYVQSLFAIAHAFAAAGEPALVERLVGPDETNPIVQWNRRLSHAQALSEAGDYADSNSQLEEILAEMEGASGPAVVDLRPKILGRLGFNALHEQDYAAALDYTTQAYDACVASEDEEGRVAYYENLMSLRVIQALKTEPELGHRLLDVRRLIVRAQDSTDAGRYQASINLLSQALSVSQSLNNNQLFRALLPKIYGLLGFNEYKLRNAAKAREHNAVALKEAETIGDADGVRIYTANLEAIDHG
jgi:tetratricopeptide (TPR) repeat protein